MKCPVHDIPDCSPILNGCTLVIRLQSGLEDRARLKSITEVMLNLSLSKQAADEAGYGNHG